MEALPPPRGPPPPSAPRPGAIARWTSLWKKRNTQESIYVAAPHNWPTDLRLRRRLPGKGLCVRDVSYLTSMGGNAIASYFYPDGFRFIKMSVRKSKLLPSINHAHRRKVHTTGMPDMAGMLRRQRRQRRQRRMTHPSWRKVSDRNEKNRQGLCGTVAVTKSV